MQKLILLVSLIFIACPAAARMYQWVNPASGRTQMSGTAPAWYRADDGTGNGKHAPRVLVFENGQLIDDTAIAVSDEQRRQLREQAFRGAELEARAASSQPEAADTLKATAPPAGSNAGQRDFSEPSPAAAAAPVVPADSDATINRMKALIEQWDKQKTEQAKTLIKQPPAPAASPSPPSSP
jgi:hypothetical protein